LKGKRAILSVIVGGPAEDYSPRGINGPIEQLLFPITHGTLFFPGMDVLPTHAVYGSGRITAAGVSAAKAAWRSRLERLFDEDPIPFRHQNGGDYPDGHVLADHVAVRQTGFTAHLAEVCGTNQLGESDKTYSRQLGFIANRPCSAPGPRVGDGRSEQAALPVPKKGR
jgi:NAD(P)H dehydrogenase (quinone)